MYEMWAEAEQNIDSFWTLTPRHFQHVMRGIRRRLKAEHEARVTQSWQTGAFTGATQSRGGLKPLQHYLSMSQSRKSSGDVIAALKTWKAAGAQISVRRVPISEYQLN